MYIYPHTVGSLGIDFLEFFQGSRCWDLCIISRLYEISKDNAGTAANV